MHKARERNDEAQHGSNTVTHTCKHHDTTAKVKQRVATHTLRILYGSLVGVILWWMMGLDSI